jgi:hypothetical protein
VAVVEIIVGRWSKVYPNPTFKMPPISVWLVELHWVFAKDDDAIQHAFGPEPSDVACQAIATWQDGPSIMKREALW